MRVRFIGEISSAVARRMPGTRRVSTLVLVGVVVAAIVVAAGHLVVVGKRAIGTTIGNELLVIRIQISLATTATVLGFAAADGENPEEAGAEGESRGDPNGGEESGANVSFDAVEFVGALDSADNDGSRGSGKTGSNANQDGGEAGNKPGQA